MDDLFPYQSIPYPEGVARMDIRRAGAIIYGAGFYTYIAYRVTPLLLLLFIPFFRKYHDFWKRTALFLVVAFLVALPLGLYFLHNPGTFFGRTAEISVTNAKSPLSEFALNFGKTLLMFNVKGDGNWRQNIAGAPELFLPVGILFLLGIAIGLVCLWLEIKRRRNSKDGDETTSSVHYPPFSILLMFAWFVLAILPSAASDEGIPHALRSTPAPPAIFFAAIAGVWAYRIAYDHGFKKTTWWL